MKWSCTIESSVQKNQSIALQIIYLDPYTVANSIWISSPSIASTDSSALYLSHCLIPHLDLHNSPVTLISCLVNSQMATCLDAVELLVDRFEALRRMPLFEALQWKDHTRLHLQLPRYQHITRGTATSTSPEVVRIAHTV